MVSCSPHVSPHTALFLAMCVGGIYFPPSANVSFSSRTWWRATWCMRFARRWRCWRSRSRSCTRGTLCWSGKTPCWSRWPTRISWARSPVSSTRAAARLHRCCSSTRSSPSTTTAHWLTAKGVRAPPIGPTSPRREPRYTRSNADFSQTGLEDPVRKDTRLLPSPWLHEAKRLDSALRVLRLRKSPSGDIFVCHREPRFEVRLPPLPGCTSLRHQQTPFKNVFIGSPWWAARRRGSRRAGAHSCGAGGQGSKGTEVFVFSDWATSGKGRFDHTGVTRILWHPPGSVLQGPSIRRSPAGRGRGALGEDPPQQEAMRVPRLGGWASARYAATKSLLSS